MPSNMLEFCSGTSRVSNCHNCSSPIDKGETKLKVNYPYSNTLRYYYVCRGCARKVFEELMSKVI